MSLSCKLVQKSAFIKWDMTWGETRWFLAEANKGHSARVWEETHWERELKYCEFHRVSKKHREIFIHLRDTQWERERVKKKKVDIFLCSSYTHKEEKLIKYSWSFWVLHPKRVRVFRGRFDYWFCGEIVFIFEIYLLYI